MAEIENKPSKIYESSNLSRATTIIREISNTFLPVRFVLCWSCCFFFAACNTQ